VDLRRQVCTELDAAFLTGPLCDISDGGGSCAADTYSRNPCPDPAVVVFSNTREAEMVYGWNVGQGRVVCENGGWENKKKRVFDVFARLFSGS